MRESELQNSVFQDLLERRPPTAIGMQALFGRLAATTPAWKECSDINWAAGEDRWVEWMNKLLQECPIPSSVEYVLFDVPSEINPASTSVFGYDPCSDDPDSVFDNTPTWPHRKRCFGSLTNELELPELDRALRHAGWLCQSKSHPETLRPAVYALSYAYTTLLVLNGLPRTKVLQTLDPRRDLAASVGWHDGDIDLVGRLTQTGWSGAPTNP